MTAALAAAVSVYANSAEADDPEPIAAVGHGGLFDRQGNQILPTPEFLARAQAWYRRRLLTQLGDTSASKLKGFEAHLSAGLDLRPQEHLIVQQRSLLMLAETAPSGSLDPQMLGKLRALDFQARQQTAAPAAAPMMINSSPIKLNPELERRLLIPFAKVISEPVGGTTASGKDYAKECAAAGVPVPPPIGQLDPAGKAGWKSLGFIAPDAQFILGSPAELRSYEDTSGMCFALPRYSDATHSTVNFDGVICLSKTTSATCFWDNQMNGKQIPYPAGIKVPIGAPDTSINPAGQYQAGGKELEEGAGGVCTACHAGENPYVIHPKADLGGGVLMGRLSPLPTFGPDRYHPLAPAKWPQNASSEPDASVPNTCGMCHVQGSAGRLPDMSTNLGEYCGTVLRQAIEKTMPPNNPGSLKDDPAVKALLAKCIASSPAPS